MFGIKDTRSNPKPKIRSLSNQHDKVATTVVVFYTAVFSLFGHASHAVCSAVYFAFHTFIFTAILYTAMFDNQSLWVPYDYGHVRSVPFGTLERV